MDIDGIGSNPDEATYPIRKLKLVDCIQMGSRQLYLSLHQAAMTPDANMMADTG